MVIDDPGIRDEVVLTLEQLRELLDDLVVRGLQTAGSEEIQRLQAAHEELQRIGAGHLAGRLGVLAEAVRSGGDGSAALLRAQTSLHLFAGIFSREVAAAQLLAEPVEPA
jgi:hypothetical protein